MAGRPLWRFARFHPAVGEPAVGDGALQPGEPGGEPDGAKAGPEAGGIERNTDAIRPQ